LLSKALLPCHCCHHHICRLPDGGRSWPGAASWCQPSQLLLCAGASPLAWHMGTAHTCAGAHWPGLTKPTLPHMARYVPGMSAWQSRGSVMQGVQGCGCALLFPLEW